MNPFVLREWKQEDAEALVIAANNKNIAANLRNVFPHPYTLEDAEAYISDCLSHHDRRQITRAVVVEETAVGSISVFVKDDVYEKSGELGYWLSEAHWGKGIMTEAVRQICREAFSKWDIIRIFAEPFDYNRGSRRVLEKAGFTYEGTMRNGVFKNGKVHSYCLYSLLREEMEE